MTLDGGRDSSTNPNAPSRRILIVDDDAVIRTLLVDVLTDPGYQLDTANNGADAIEKLEREHFDLVVTDMVMPKANGLDVLLASKRLEPDRPVVIITGFPSVATAVKLASLGAAPREWPARCGRARRRVPQASSGTLRGFLQTTVSHSAPQGASDRQSYQSEPTTA